jgi:arylsulfatase A-like enzyme
MEYVFATLVPLLTRAHGILTAEQWRALAILFSGYAIVGLAAGAAIAWMARETGPESRRFCTILLLSPVLAFILNAAWSHASALERGAVAAAAVVVAIALIWKRCLGAAGIGTAAAISGLLLNFAAWFPSAIGRRFPGWLLVAVLPGVVIALLAGALLGLRAASLVGRRLPTSRAFARAAGILSILALFGGAELVSSYAEGGPAARRPDGPAAPASPRPNVLLVVLDTVRADHLGLYGYTRNTTPRLKEFAEHATLYGNAFAAAPLTLTSHASIFTGLYPQSHGAYHVSPNFPQGRPMADTFPTVASVLTLAGYRTAAVMANRYFLRPDFGMTRGFQYADWQQPVEMLNSSRGFFLRSRFRNFLPPAGAMARAMDARTLTAGEVNSRAYSLLDGGPPGTPFFLFLNYMDAHEPFLPPPPYDRMYPGSEIAYRGLDFDVNKNNVAIDPKAREYFVSQYDGALGYLDEKLAEVFALLKKQGIYDRTLIIVTSDHGEAFGDRNIVGHGTSLYEDQIRIPLLVKYAGQSQPKRVEAPAGHVDLMPTILEAAGVAIPDGIQGVALPRLEELESRPVVAEFHGDSENSGPRFECCKFAIISGSYKLIYSTQGSREVFDLAADPAESRNLDKPETPLSAALLGQLTAWSRRTVPRYLSAKESGQDEIERLKSLGYAGHR